MMRVFAALPIQANVAIRELLQELQACGRGVRTVPEQNLHLTLRFFGDVDDPTVQELSACVGVLAQEFSVVKSRLVGMRAFPNMRRPRIVWAALASESALFTLATRLDELCQSIAVPARDHRFQAHCTLARVRGPSTALSELLDRYAEQDFGPQVFNSIVLYQSEMTKRGPRYRALQKANL